jgi:hypothetical protein
MCPPYLGARVAGQVSTTCEWSHDAELLALGVPLRGAVWALAGLSLCREAFARPLRSLVATCGLRARGCAAGSSDIMGMRSQAPSFRLETLLQRPSGCTTPSGRKGVRKPSRQERVEERTHVTTTENTTSPHAAVERACRYVRDLGDFEAGDGELRGRGSPRDA